MGLSEPKKERFNRFVKELGLAEDDALLLAENKAVASFFEDALKVHPFPRNISNWIINEVLREIKGTSIIKLSFGGKHLGRLVALVEDGTISGRMAKEVFAEMVKTGKSPEQIVGEKGLSQMDDPEKLAPVVAKIMASYPEKVVSYREGKTGLIGFFVGRVMQETRGKANPELVQEILKEKLA